MSDREYHHDRDLIPIFMCDMIETKYCCQFTDRSVLSTETDSCLSLSIKYDQEELRIHIVKFKYITSWVSFVTSEIERHAICDTLYFPSRRDVKIFFRPQYFFIESLRIMNMGGKNSTKNIKVNQQITFDIDYNASTWTSEDIFGSSVDLRHRPRYGNISKNHLYLSSIVLISFWIFLLSSPNTSFLCVLSRSNLSIFPDRHRRLHVIWSEYFDLYSTRTDVMTEFSRSFAWILYLSHRFELLSSAKLSQSRSEWTRVFDLDTFSIYSNDSGMSEMIIDDRHVSRTEIVTIYKYKWQISMFPSEEIQES